MNNDPAITYRVNANDEIIYVNDSWSLFAVHNGAPELAEADLVGNSLWDFISDESTRYLYGIILDRVRRGMPVDFNFRCDSPELRRKLRMSIRLIADDQVEFESRTVSIKIRRRQAIFDRLAPRTSEMIHACSWCCRFKSKKDEWLEIEYAATELFRDDAERLPLVTHGMCHDCNQRMMSAFSRVG